MLGNNMRDVAVTDGDRVESEIRFGWNVNYYGIGDVADIADSVTDSEIEAKMSEYAENTQWQPTTLPLSVSKPNTKQLWINSSHGKDKRIHRYIPGSPRIESASRNCGTESYGEGHRFRS